MTEAVILSVGLAFLFNYSIGKPGGEFSPYEIFSSYTLWLSKWRLRRYGLLDQYWKQFGQNIKNKKPVEVIEISNDFDRIIYNAAEPFFTWERMVGMCIICTGFWISLIIGILVTGDWLQVIENIVISHILIRIINKFL